MINPSTADAAEDDRTIRLLYDITKRWNYDGFYVGNLYPFRSSTPADLRTHITPDTIHQKNIASITEMAADSALVVYAWGTKGPDPKQKEPDWLKQLIQTRTDTNVYTIGTTTKHIPKHPNQWGPNVTPIPDAPILLDPMYRWMSNNSKHKGATAKFLAHYTSRIDDLLSMPSGTHAPDPAKLAAWVAAQASPRRRAAAQTLADNIRYITHTTVIKYCKALITQMYTDSEKPIPEENTLKWFVGPSSKSAYFIAILCYHFAKESGYRLPDLIMTEHFDLDDCSDSTIFYLDDMSYTGSQIYQLLQTIHVTAAKQNPAYVNKKKAINMNVIKGLPIDLRVGACVLSERAQKQLETFKYSNTILTHGAYGKIPIPNPFKRYVVEVLPDLKTILDPQAYADTVIFFSPYRDPPCICYFDHKLADTNSTFTNVLRFGLVPPTTLDYKFIYIHNDRKWSFTKPYHNQDKETTDKIITETQFMPFVIGCAPPPPALKARLEALPYHILMMTSSDELDDTGKNTAYAEYFIDTSNTELFNYKNSVKLRCPHSWYKNSYFSGGSGISRSRSRSTRTRTAKQLKRTRTRRFRNSKTQ